MHASTPETVSLLQRVQHLQAAAACSRAGCPSGGSGKIDRSGGGGGSGELPPDIDDKTPDELFEDMSRLDGGSNGVSTKSVL